MYNYLCHIPFYKCHLYLFVGEELFGTKIYKPNKIMVLVLDEINEDLVLGSSVAGLLTETVIDLVRHHLTRFVEENLVLISVMST